MCTAKYVHIHEKVRHMPIKYACEENVHPYTCHANLTTYNYRSEYNLVVKFIIYPPENRWFDFPSLYNC